MSLRIEVGMSKVQSQKQVLGIPLASAWWRHGVWNLLEHGVTRLADIAVSFTLIRVLAPERFSKLALAQAAIAPLLIIFLSPSSALARDFSKWRNQPGALSRNLRSFRHYGWMQGFLGVGLAALIALVRTGGGGEPFWERFWPLLWAFGMVLAPVVSTADRDFLRMDLKLGTVNRLNALQKFGTLGVSLFVIFAWGARFDALALAVWLVVVVIAFLSRQAAEQSFPAGGQAVTPLAWGERLRRVWDALGSYGLQIQFTGVVFGTLQTGALLFAGLYALEAQEAGLLGAASKVANFAYAVPFALSQAFILWMARRPAPKYGSFDQKVEYRRLGAVMCGVGALGLGQCVAVIAAAPFLVVVLSGGRWTETELEVATVSMRILIISTLPMIFLAVSAVWFSARSGVMRSIYTVYLPWAFASILMPWIGRAFGVWAGRTALDFAWLQLAQAAVLGGFLAVEWGRLLLVRK